MTRRTSISRMKLRRKPKRPAANTAKAKVRKTAAPPGPKTQFSPFWTEALFGAEILILHATPVYYGLGVPRGDGSAVVIIPGFLGTDVYLTELHAWLGSASDTARIFPGLVSMPNVRTCLSSAD